jgi:hypothetical protein
MGGEKGEGENKPKNHPHLNPPPSRGRKLMSSKEEERSKRGASATECYVSKANPIQSFFLRKNLKIKP